VRNPLLSPPFTVTKQCPLGSLHVPSFVEGTQIENTWSPSRRISVISRRECVLGVFFRQRALSFPPFQPDKRDFVRIEADLPSSPRNSFLESENKYGTECGVFSSENCSCSTSPQLRQEASTRGENPQLHLDLQTTERKVLVSFPLSAFSSRKTLYDFCVFLPHTLPL